MSIERDFFKHKKEKRSSHDIVKKNMWDKITALKRFLHEELTLKEVKIIKILSPKLTKVNLV